MMEYIQELRGWDLYSLQVGVCHVFSVCQALMLWDRCCENGSVMSPVFKWSSALPSDDGKRPAHLCLRAPQVVTAELHRCETHLIQDFSLRGCHRHQPSPLTLIKLKIGTVEHLATKKCHFTIWRAWSALYGNSDPCAHNQYKCANYSLTCFDFLGQEVFISFFVCYFYIAIFSPAIGPILISTMLSLT